MTREEAKQLIMTLAAAYPNYHPADFTYTVDIWAVMLDEYDFGQAQTALKKYILSDTSGFAPSIGQLVEQMQGIRETEDIGEMGAWTMVRAAISRAIYYAEDEFAKFPPVVKSAVVSPANLKEWALMDTDTVNSVIQSNVMRSYRAAAKAMKDEAKLSSGFREMINGQRTEPERLMRQEPEPESYIPEQAPRDIASSDRVEEMVKAFKVSLNGSAAAGKKNAFNNFTQRDNDYEAIQNALIEKSMQ